MTTDRRTFLQLLAAGAGGATLEGCISRALQIPAQHRTGTIGDVEHIVIMMQENRSFDHYFGALRGVRGFGDTRTVTLPSGKPVWCQPRDGGYVMPFRPTAPNLGLQFLQDLPHDWTSTQLAWNQGKYDQWVAAKGTTTMAHLTRSDIPFHYALADAFTVCDAYHCSVLGPTDPNRHYMWTGWVGNDGKGGGPAIDNATEAGYDWPTFPERLQKAGVSWKVYQDVGLGLNADSSWGAENRDAYIGNYGDNSLLYFHQYQNALPGSSLFEGARAGTRIAESGSLFDRFRSDVLAGTLPQVSWVVAPEAYTEHPNWPANYGAWYVSQILDALTANPEVWSKTAFFLTYDENDGFFDHMVPPSVPTSRAHGLSSIDTVNEIFPGNSTNPSGPYGMGVRVPMIVISPWSKGGWVNSQVFDHTSLIQFIEQRFGARSPGLQETNITPWRRAVAGDLTSAFNFATPNDAGVPLPSTLSYRPPDKDKHSDYIPVPPLGQSLPEQEPGMRPARALPYETQVWADIDLAQAALNIHFNNSGKAAAVFQVRGRNGDAGPWTYTVGAQSELSDAWVSPAIDLQGYELSVHGPNGFLRTFKGALAGPDRSNLEVAAVYDVQRCGIALRVRNRGESPCQVRILNGYGKETTAHDLRAGETLEKYWPLASTFGWYDLAVEAGPNSAFRQHLAGHVETGKDSMSDPGLGLGPAAGRATG
jgi:phospholipase C